ncbi:MAG: cytochrome c nitrite reductase small subunit [Capnocytophaga sp.]|uniref:cytochrome c nitrite reductase small subunit n=1 Tax=Capnocytophaga sp. TaxID=44737 RepID=UPI003F9F6365
MATTNQDTRTNKKRFFRFLIPVLAGMLIGLAGYIFYISKAHSYLSDDPKACVNCHIMEPEYATWFHSSHGRNTVCNDCHVPHDNVFRKYYFKANDGLRHATMFTFRMEPQVIRMHAPGQKVVQENCIRCHSDLVSEVSIGKVTAPMAHQGNGKLCWECHREVPHSRVRGLNSAPSSPVPIIDDMPENTPDWIQEIADKAKQKK